MRTRVSRIAIGMRVMRVIINLRKVSPLYVLTFALTCQHMHARDVRHYQSPEGISRICPYMPP